MKGTPEPDSGTGKAGPLGGPTNRRAVDTEADWITPDRSRPWLQRNVKTGRVRTLDYYPTTPIAKG